MNVFTPSFMLASGVPAMLPERSRTSAISVGLVIISGAAVSASVTLSDPSQSILSVLITLFELVRPILLSPSGRCPKTIYAAELLFDTCGGLCCFLEKAREKSRQKAACGGGIPTEPSAVRQIWKGEAGERADGVFCVPGIKRRRSKANFAPAWSWRPDLNRRPTHYECVALPTELHQQIVPCYYTQCRLLCQSKLFRA